MAEIRDPTEFGLRVRIKAQACYKAAHRQIVSNKWSSYQTESSCVG